MSVGSWTLPPGRAGDPGLFGPDSVVWVVARERALLLGGPAAVLLQLAHPLVAAGVAAHSDFRRDPLRRLTGTMQTTLTITFGDHHQAAAAAKAVRVLHSNVAGTLPKPQGAWPAGTPYRATDPDLALWVFATLVETAFATYDLFVAPLDDDRRSRYYEQSAPFAASFGVRPPVLPGSYRAFRSYYDDALDGLITVGDLAREQAHAVLRSRLRGLPVTPSGHLLASLLLPERLRLAYRLPPAPRAVVRPLRLVITRLPDAIRYWPHYGTAMRRVAAVEPAQPTATPS